MNYFLLVSKLVIGFFSMLILLNLFGYRNLAPTTATDQIYNYVLGGTIGGAIYNENISVLQFISVLIIWGLLIKTLDILKTKYSYIRNLIDGSTLILYEDDKFNQANLRKANMSVQDFYNKIRQNGINSVTDLRYAEVSKNGNLILLEKGTTDFGLLVIYEGKINVHELERSGLSKKELFKQLKKEGVNSISNIYSVEYLDGEFIIKFKD